MITRCALTKVGWLIVTLATLSLLFRTIKGVVRAPYPTQESNLNKRLNQWRELIQAPGASFAAVNWITNKRFEAVSGSLSYASKHPVTVTTPFQFGSIVKQFVIVGILKLNQQAKIDLHAPLGKILNTRKTTLTLPEFWKKTPIIQLMNMTSAIPSYWSNPAFQAARRTGNNRWKSDSDLIQSMTSFPPRIDKWQYSDTNTLLLGKVIEAITHKTCTNALADWFHLEKSLRQTHFGQASLNSMTDKHTRAMAFSMKGGTGPEVHVGDASRFLLSRPHDMAYWIGSLFETDRLSVEQKRLMNEFIDKHTGQPLKNPRKTGYSLAMDRVYQPGVGFIYYYPGNSLGFSSLVAWSPSLHQSLALSVNRAVDPSKLFQFAVDYFKSVHRNGLSDEKVTPDEYTAALSHNS